MPPQLPERITALVIDNATPGSLVLTWQAPSRSTDDYRVSWARSDANYTSWRSPDGNAYPTGPTLTLTDLDEGVEYKVRIRPRFDQNSDSPSSGAWTTGRQTVSTTPDPTPTPTPTPATPAELPTAGQMLPPVVTQDDTGVTISWVAPDPLPNYYHVEWTPAQSDYTPGLTNETDRYVYEGTALTVRSPGEGIYRFRMRTHACSDPADPSSCAFTPWSADFATTLTPPPPPPDQTATVADGPLVVLKESIGAQRYDDVLTASIATDKARNANTGSSADTSTRYVPPTKSQILPYVPMDRLLIDWPDSGHYATMPGVEYVWWMSFEIGFSTGWGKCRTEGYVRQTGAEDPSMGLILPNSGLHFLYDGVRQTLLPYITTVGVINNTSDRRYYMYLLWLRDPSDTTILDSSKMSFDWDITYHRFCVSGEIYNRMSEPPTNGTWVQVQNLSGGRHRHQYVSDENGDRRSIGYFTNDPVWIAPNLSETNWRRTFTRIKSIGVTSVPANGASYVAGEDIVVRVTYHGFIPASTLTLPLQVGERLVELTATKTERTDHFDFTYTVLADDEDPYGVSVPANSIVSTLSRYDLFDRGHGAHYAGHTHTIYGPPFVKDITFTSTALQEDNKHLYLPGDQMEITAQFSQDVDVTGDPELLIQTVPFGKEGEAENGNYTNATPRTFTYDASDSTGDTMVFTYTVTDQDYRAFYLPEGNELFQLDADDSITDDWRAVGSRLPAILNHEHFISSHQYDPKARLQSVEVTSTPTEGNNDTYGLGDEIAITATFSQPVTVTGAPKFIIALTSSPPYPNLAYQASRSTPNTMVFTYTVLAADNDSDGLFWSAQRTKPNGDKDPFWYDGTNTIKTTVSDVDAVINFTGSGNLTGHKVDGSQ